MSSERFRKEGGETDSACRFPVTADLQGVQLDISSAEAV